MAYRASVFEVLIASPSDVVWERDKVEAAIHEWNGEFSRDLGVVLLPRRWEKHSSPEMGDRPQALINKQLGTADILVGVFWSELGTPTGKAESGTVEEINEFIGLQRPVLLYFSSASVPNSVDVDQVARLREFKRDVKGRGLYRDFTSMTHLTNSLRQDLTYHARQLLQATDPKAGLASNDSPTIETPNESPFAANFSDFVRWFQADWETERDSDPVNIDEAIGVLRNVRERLGSFVKASNDARFTRALGDVRKDVRKLEDHRIVMDGGVSFKAFWAGGNEVLAKLQHISSEFEPSVTNGSPSSVRSDTEETQKRLTRFQAQTEGLLRQFEAEWTAEHDSQPASLDGGKDILRRVRSDLLNVRAQFSVDAYPEVAQEYDRILKELRVLDRHQLLADGGRSYQSFWSKGMALLVHLNDLVKIIERRRADRF